MASSLTWIDHDAAARERSLRILSLFQEKESRDELGLGGIRDAFADRFFPGTSTIQTRLRYFLFVPWIYQRLEAQRVPTAQFAARARRLEIDLIAPLLANEDRAGVFGRTAGRGLKRLPSSVYWAGLGAWGVRGAAFVDLPQSAYHLLVDQLYVRRSRERARTDEEGAPDRATVTWHARLPRPPAGFPERVDVALTREEAEFLLDRILTSCTDSLLAHLARHTRPEPDAWAPWVHTQRAHFPPHQQRLLEHARRFSAVMYGAALLYNLALAEVAGREALVAEHRAEFSRWAAEDVPRDDLGRWSLAELWRETLDHGHTITPLTRRFVDAWVAAVLAGPQRLLDDPAARAFLRAREQEVKGRAHARFTNRRALLQWNGRAGLARMTYRWSTAQRFLKDLHDGLQRAEGDA
jgi:hypothetical protein